MDCSSCSQNSDALSSSSGSMFDRCHSYVQIDTLRRFMPQLLYIRQPGVERSPAASPNIAAANSLEEVFAPR